ncbi:uncharacterized protein LY89DRAFT_790008 [Mollisia scopiformis]|uniref:NB-ARC domain-containing protein n=1 Tax=Mollisia scopiformis TaxID=149040 RepID=A0A132B4R1_MOLSC|nr:uncharacterized protein LY89DRAFT_790008 [Mollisia scopiformis]KUJ07233.1 hypothetical protein LY89DRAFT_790008 [Mollisia scopiformis]
MADPISVLGALSAVTQLADQLARVISAAINVYKRYKDPRSTFGQLSQVEQLVQIAGVIKSKPSLQNSAVQNVLANCLQDAEKLRDILDKIVVIDGTDSRRRRIKKSLAAMMKDKEVMSILNSLERDKSALQLCISVIEASNIADISAITRGTSSNVDELLKFFPEIRDLINNGLSKLSKLSSTIVSDDTLEPTNYFLVPNGRLVSEFVGRTDILEKIESGFLAPFRRGSRIVVLHGLGGQGKTQIALEICRRAKAKGTNAIFWVDASSAHTVKKSFKTIAEATKRPHEHVPDDAIDMILSKFGDWPLSWIMVFDNYDDVRGFDDIGDLIPNGANGCVLITSRNSESSQLASTSDCSIELLGLSEKDALEVLFNNAKQQANEKVLDHAKKIVHRLVYHSLAITQAGSYIRQKKIHLDQFLGYYETHRANILRHTPQLTRYRRHLSEGEKETSLNVFTTWELSFEQLLHLPAGDNKAALLILLAFFDCKDISEELFIDYTDRAQRNPWCYDWPVPCLEYCLGEELKDEIPTPLNALLEVVRPWDGDLFIEIVSELAQLSLVQSWSRHDENICQLTIYPLVRDWIRLRTEPDVCNKFCIVSGKVLAATLEAHSDGYFFHFSLPATQALFSHIEVYNENLEILEARHEGTKDWHHERLDVVDEIIGDFLYRSRQNDESSVFAQRVLDARLRELGQTHSDSLRAKTQIATMLSADHQYEQAVSIIREVLETQEANLPPDDPEVLKTMISLSWALQKTSNTENLGEAEMLARTIVNTRLLELGLEDEKTLKSLHHLANILRKLRKYDEAEGITRVVMDVCFEILPPNHSQTLCILHDFILVLRAQEKYEESETVLRECIAGQDMGDENPERYFLLGTLAFILRKRGKHQEAVESLKQAIAGFGKILGPEHQTTLRYSKKLSKLLGEIIGNGQNTAPSAENTGSSISSEEVQLTQQVRIGTALFIS